MSDERRKARQRIYDGKRSARQQREEIIARNRADGRLAICTRCGGQPWRRIPGEPCEGTLGMASQGAPTCGGSYAPLAPLTDALGRTRWVGSPPDAAPEPARKDTE